MVPELRDPSVRELIIGRYRLIYEIDEETVNVLAVIHGARLLRDVLRSLDF
jgi:plasmid stabilization system protein ParE